ncbi:hypothetical protein DICPUDRAFT_76178 [Dictyostelium purpureum]|uniref:TRAF-type domain-containing protein n=1 Tax=Dictyostelium purpureum TaxID=5786 RepID=F0ZCU6_DICPU|nr:uncharacterized protein DICPUDRAFT_76178 [Dictyostelium purpureum]EGC38220.1 hypothetical protein DICPUDRAFT_76178 [Dictyostelium purpureum]|eukprot:XP_003285258.1 hypothetical protein DICPUDRAFT_76178 [Dictyostelium purpureum]
MVEKILIILFFKKIYCPNSFINSQRGAKDGGCEETITIDSIETHLNICLFTEINCVNSSNCGKFRRGEMGTHIEQCQYEIKKCECNHSFIGKDMEEHKAKICPETLIECEYCNMKFKRIDLGDHIDEDCPKKEISCPYSKYSCEFKTNRGEMQNHLDHYDHLVLVKNRCDYLEIFLKGLESTILTINQHSESNLNIFKNQIKDINEQNKYSSKWIIHNWSDKVKKYQKGQCLTSPVFTISQTKKFNIRVYPNGEKENKLTISLCKQFDSKCKVNYRFEVINFDFSQSIFQEKTFTFAIGTNVYNSNIIYEDWNNTKGFLIDNTLTIGFNIKIEKLYGDYMTTA